MLKEQINTEEATKNAFVMPVIQFIQIPSYDIFNSTEVIPEFICDIEAKKADEHNSQLHRYYHVSKQDLV